MCACVRVCACVRACVIMGIQRDGPPRNCRRQLDSSLFSQTGRYPQHMVCSSMGNINHCNVSQWELLISRPWKIDRKEVNWMCWYHSWETRRQAWLVRVHDVPYLISANILIKSHIYPKRETVRLQLRYYFNKSPCKQTKHEGISFNLVDCIHIFLSVKERELLI